MDPTNFLHFEEVQIDHFSPDYFQKGSKSPNWVWTKMVLMVWFEVHNMVEVDNKVDTGDLDAENGEIESVKV